MKKKVKKLTNYELRVALRSLLKHLAKAESKRRKQFRAAQVARNEGWC